ncbi:MAG: hypothetical protein KZQ64_04815 [gamma proteobacterium symbiont of Bathyaustriella thionipta]|nr:hypothetical protein [gamma proteobacterium symbiont of Bathyaustriella thionipta]MCU7951221.1 hypothetical protein [gamma proteobacterium symbiont of Bathyaustriella thionipta]MCU7952699.1 hypothetical protein [gamma proteobacterium symbiont of Bathyaustriella thionipta]MCU7957742.1 hypothetical protein [gamma proteobacterium symbiont of Bathyaustriella thionipta]MCU7968056.1 hypothetical protein [gamma proteobacterium symbiont of Bathyaustriella thionipta]
MYKMLPVNKILVMILSSILLLLIVTSVSAGTKYLFPSDVIDQSEQAQYDIERVERYESQRNWYYPQEQSRVEKNIFYPESKQFQIRKKSSWYEQSDHYKYDDFNLNTLPGGQIHQPEQYYPTNDFNRETQYQKDNYPKQYSVEQPRNIRPPAATNKMQQRYIPESFRKPVYASDFDANGYITNKPSVNMNPYTVPSYDSPLYKNEAYNSRPNYDWTNDNGKQQVQIQYVPVPVYKVPGTLPGTVPGIVTPGNMVPGYSHLSPNYEHSKKKSNNSKGMYDVMGSPYNPFSGFGIFPGDSNPFNGLYKSYNNSSENGFPFLSPDTMIPAFSKPEAFLSH